jgi:hypothetical protein
VNASIILEYTCTDAELREARTLGLRQSRQKFVIPAVYALLLVVIYFRIRGDVAPKYQPYFMLVAVGLILLFHFGLSSRKKQPVATKLELSEKGVCFLAPDSNMEMPWTAFSKRLESRNLFVLVDRPQRLLYTLPKRAFPNEEAMSWFRSCTDRISMNETAAPEKPSPNIAVAAAGGVSISYDLRYSDYLGQMLASWRFKGVVLLVYGIIFGETIYSEMEPPSGNVNSPMTALLFVTSPITVMLLLFLFGIPFLRARSHRRHFGPQQVLLDEEGIRFSERDASGALPWSSYRYFKETRRSFILWKPGGIEGTTTALFPKRAFAAAADVERTRDLFNRKLRYSRWYF